MARPLPFLPPETVTAALAEPPVIELADMDGDGALDAISLSRTENRCAVFLNTNGDGTGWTEVLVADTGLAGPEEAVAVDIDGDGDPDLVVGSPGNDRVVFFENLGEALAWAPGVVMLNGPDSPVGVGAGDVDCDGDVDVVASAEGAGEIYFLENTAGDGSAWNAWLAASGLTGARAVQLADVDRDGDLDVVAAGRLSGDVAWFENMAGDGSAWAPAAIIVSGINDPYDLIVADMDKDGDVDVAVANRDSTSVADTCETIPGDTSLQTSLFSKGNVFTVDAAETLTDFSMDLNLRGGTVDLYYFLLAGDAPFDPFTVVWSETRSETGSGFQAYSANLPDQILDPSKYYVAGIGWAPMIDYRRSFGTAPLAFTDVGGTVVKGFEGVGPDPLSFETNPIDDTHAMELCFAGASALNNESFLLFRNLDGAGGSWSPGTTVAGGHLGAQSLAAQDIDGDGDLDLAGVAFTDGDALWFENASGDASAWMTHPISDSLSQPSGIALGDIDGDGDVDAAASEGAANRLHWFENDLIHRNAAFCETIPINNPTTAYSVVAADIDGDGDLDAVNSGAYAGGVFFSENVSGDGGTWATTTIAGPGPQHAKTAAGDVDGDGDLDVVSASYYGMDWHANTLGDGSAWTTNVIAVNDNYLDVVLGDMDGGADGLCALDVVAVRLNTLVLFDNSNGDGTSWTASTVSNTLGFALSVDAGDVDGDGDLDLVVADFVGNQVLLFENSAGDASVWNQRTVTSAENNPFGVELADIDGDGDLDVVAGIRNSNQVIWCENTAGDGTSWTRGLIGLANGANEVIARDIDGDGDVDVACAAFDENAVRVFINLLGDGSSWQSTTVTTSATSAIAVDLADVDCDGDLDVLSAALGSDSVDWHPNVGGQFMLETAGGPGGAVDDGDITLLFDFNAVHNGRPGDVDQEIEVFNVLFEET
ncbi:MAG: VCBS repeat-containing protein, partial [Sumerlaeia bacterium]